MSRRLMPGIRDFEAKYQMCLISMTNGELSQVSMNGSNSTVDNNERTMTDITGQAHTGTLWAP